MQKHNPQLVKLNNKIGFIKNNFNSKKINIYKAYYETAKIKDYKIRKDLNKALMRLLGKWRYFIGIKEELTEEEIYTNVNFIKENFSQLSLVDIEQAMNLSINGELDINVEHYQSFTPMYISKILNAYKQYRGKIVIGINKKLSTLELKEQTNNVSIAEKLEITKENLNVMYNSKDDSNFYDYGSVVYNFIKRNKLIKITKSLVNEAMDYGKKRATSNIRKSFAFDSINNLQTHKTELEKKEYNIRNYARIYVVQKWLNSFDKKQWKTFLSKVNTDMI